MSGVEQSSCHVYQCSSSPTTPLSLPAVSILTNFIYNLLFISLCVIYFFIFFPPSRCSHHYPYTHNYHHHHYLHPPRHYPRYGMSSRPPAPSSATAPPPIHPSTHPTIPPSLHRSVSMRSRTNTPVCPFVHLSTCVYVRERDGYREKGRVKVRNGGSGGSCRQCLLIMNVVMG